MSVFFRTAGASCLVDARSHGVRGAALAACMLFSGCGRVGFELWPMDAGHEEDQDTGPGEEQDAGDAASEMDAGDDAAIDGGIPYVDGCVPGPNGGCTPCEPDAYVEDKSCGTGCFDTPSRCLNGIEYPCLRGRPLSVDDTTCDGVDDNCNGMKDEDYRIEVSTCGIGVCTVTGGLVCDHGEVRNTCTPTAPMSMRDDAMGNGNGLDDDCDGSIDEDVSSCTNTMPRAYEMGTHNIAVPTGCGTVTIQLWGGGGAAGERAGISEVRPGGKGGSGGYVRSMLSVTGAITLHVGGGASASCADPLSYSMGGTNAGAPTYAGGAGSGSPRSRGGAGLDGLDGMVAMGGKGASNLLGSSGGNGFYGGGGGGDGWADFVNGLLPEHGGGGGAASVAFMSGTRVLVAGGGGGGGAAATLVYAFGDTGGKGGEGCSGNGTSGNNARVGGGGGGGVCMGTGMGVVRSMGTNGEPANASSLPRGIARGSAECEVAGGNGYAIVTFAR